SGGALGSFGALLVKAGNGLEREKKILPVGQDDDAIPNSWSADGRQILYTHQGSASYHLELVPSAGGKSVPFATGPGNQTNGQISPGGNGWLNDSNESGGWEISATPFPTAAGKWMVSRGGGPEPRGRGDGKEFFYLGPNGMLTAVPASSAGGFATG